MTISCGIHFRSGLKKPNKAAIIFCFHFLQFNWIKEIIKRINAVNQSNNDILITLTWKKRLIFQIADFSLFNLFVKFK